MYTLEELQAIVNKCYRCPLSKTRTNVVFGEGNKNATIMFVGKGQDIMRIRQGDLCRKSRQVLII